MAAPPNAGYSLSARPVQCRRTKHSAQSRLNKSILSPLLFISRMQAGPSDKRMFDQAVHKSDAMKQAAQQACVVLIPVRSVQDTRNSADDCGSRARSLRRGARSVHFRNSGETRLGRKSATCGQTIRSARTASMGISMISVSLSASVMRMPATAQAIMRQRP